MEKKFLLIAFILISIAGNAQQWALRGSINSLKSYGQINLISLNSKSGETSVSAEYPNSIRLGNRLREFPRLSYYLDISLIKNFSKKQSIIIGFRNMQPLITTTIQRKGPSYFDRLFHGETINLPSLKLNYLYTFLQKDNLNASSLSVFAGLLIIFKSKEGTFDNGSWGTRSGTIDSSGNVVFTDYTMVKKTGVWRPKYPMPYLNAGIDGGLRLSKRLKIGMELAVMVGYKTVYKQTHEGVSDDATFTYDIKLKPNFFSGGIYLQYRIK